MEEFPIVVDVELSLFAQVAGHIPMVMNEAAAHEDHCVMAVFQDAVAMCQMGENPFLVVTGWDTFDVPKGMKGHKVRQFLEQRKNLVNQKVSELLARAEAMDGFLELGQFKPTKKRRGAWGMDGLN